MSKKTVLPKLNAVGGSFRDPTGRVYNVSLGGKSKKNHIIRALDDVTYTSQCKLLKLPFFIKAVERGDIVNTWPLESSVASKIDTKELGWSGFLEHDVVDTITFPYEWTFSMLKDAALLQLRLLRGALKAGWTLKDATPYNIQFNNGKPIFIDTPSFVERGQGEPWLAYRQFASMFLYPLMLKAYKDISFQPVLRSALDGLSATEMNRYLSFADLRRRGVLSQVFFPARVEASIATRERDRAPATKREVTHSDAMVFGFVDSMTRLVKRLKSPIVHTDWSKYANNHSYEAEDDKAKRDFVENCARLSKPNTTWDLGCNTGTYSKICAQFSDRVIAVDGDHDAVETLYLENKGKEDQRITPLVMDLSNMSPDHGFAGTERLRLDRRVKPDLVVCLAIIHHLRISANIPLDRYFTWLSELKSDVVIEFVDRHDEMVKKLLMNKSEQYHDYTSENFQKTAAEYFNIVDSKLLKDGARHIFYLQPKNR